MIFPLRIMKNKSEQNPDAEDWHPGDVAECIFAGPWVDFYSGIVDTGPGFGSRFSVADVVTVQVPGLGAKQSLVFKAYPGVVYNAAKFRKVRPQADEQIAADAAFRETIHRPSRSLPVSPREPEVAA